MRLLTLVMAISVLFNKQARYNSMAKWQNIVWLVSMHLSSQPSSHSLPLTPPNKVATSRLLTMSSASHELSPELRPSTDWESKPSNEP